MPESLNKDDLRYGTARHQKIVDALQARIRIAENKVAEKEVEMEESENQFLAYLPETENDAIRRTNRKQGGVHSYTTLQVPYSYAMLLSAHTYWTSVFLGRSPVMQFAARHGEPENQVLAVEALMDYQVQVGRMLAPFYLWMHDAPKYGYGVVWNYWDREEVMVSRIEERPREYMGMPIPGTRTKVKVTEKVAGYVGNRVFNVRPYDFLPDPRVPLTNLQRGEFVGRRTSDAWTALVAGEKTGRYFNLAILYKLLKKGQAKYVEGQKGSEQVDMPDREYESLQTPDITDIGFVDLVEMVVRLIPKDWELGQSDRPELWSFTVANKNVLIEARPYGAYHAKFPAAVLPYEMDAYAFSTRSMMEILKPLEDTMSWLFNTHFFNVRAVLNNQFVFDPSRVMTKDLTNPNAGKLIRLKESAYGTDVRSAISQLQVMDITQNNLRDIQLVGEMMQRVSGVTDNIMGMVNAGGRKTATEVRTSSSFGINRLKTTAEFWSAGDFSLLTQMMLQNTQQYYDLERKYRVAGDLMGLGNRQMQQDQEQAATPFIDVTPDSIQGFYDFVPVDGTMPIDRFAQANIWKDILFGLGKMPQIGMQYDLGGIFGWMARLAGLKNIQQFRIQVAPDDMLRMQAEQGNLIPLKGGQGGQRTRAGGGAGNAGGNAAGVAAPIS